MLARASKFFAFSVLVLLVADLAFAAPGGRGRAREKEHVRPGQTQGRIHEMANMNSKGMREAYVNNLYNKLQNRELARVLQEIYLRPEKVENDPAAIKGVEKFIDLIKKHESMGRTPDEAVELALRELRPDLKLSSKDLLEACR